MFLSQFNTFTPPVKAAVISNRDGGDSCFFERISLQSSLPMFEIEAGDDRMTASSLIAIDSRPVEHLRLPDGFLSLLTGTVLRLYGERICWGKLPSDKPFFVAAYFLPSLTYYVSALVDP